MDSPSRTTETGNHPPRRPTRTWPSESDQSAVTVGRFLAARNEGRAERILVEIGLALSTVREWFPVRTIVADTPARVGSKAVDALDSWSAPVLAEYLHLPLFTTSDEVAGNRIDIYRPW